MVFFIVKFFTLEENVKYLFSLRQKSFSKITGLIKAIL